MCPMNEFLQVHNLQEMASAHHLSTKKNKNMHWGCAVHPPKKILGGAVAPPP